MVIILGETEGLESALAGIDGSGGVGGSTSGDVRVGLCDVGDEGGREVSSKPR